MSDKEIFEDMEEISKIPENDLHGGDSKLKKFFVFIGGTILLLLMLSYVFVTYPVSAIIEGKLESTVLNVNELDLGEFSVFFDDDIYEELRTLYFEERNVEFSVCLLGDKRNKDYHIDSLYQPKMYEQYFNRVVFDPCSKDTLLILHTHPYKKCLASQTDLNMLAKTKKVNPDVLMVVMCESDRFSVYS